MRETYPPKSSRAGVRMQCQICYEYGYNKRGCTRKDNLPAPPSKQHN